MAINKHFLQLEFSSGLFYEYSKDQKDGYEKHTSNNGNVSYRNYYNKGVQGVLESASVYEKQMGDKTIQQISLSIKDGDEVYYAPVELYDGKGNVSTFAESLVRFLPELNKGDNIIYRPYNFKPDGEKYSKIGVSFRRDGEKIKPSMSNSYYKGGELVEGDIPAIEWVEKLGKKKPSATSLEAKDDFLLGVVEKETERLKWDGGDNNQNSSQPQADPKANKPKAKADESKSFIPPKQEDDDLPFG